MGKLVDRTHADLSDAEIQKITSTYHSWRSASVPSPYSDVPGFARAASVEDIRLHKYSLVPGRYVGFHSRPGVNVDLKALQAELDEIVERFEQVKEASEAAAKTLNELAYG
jgi:type I restriction enzyme M protein